MNKFLARDIDRMTRSMSGSKPHACGCKNKGMKGMRGIELPAWISLPAGDPDLVGTDEQFGRYELAITSAKAPALNQAIAYFDSLSYPTQVREFDAWNDEITSLFQSQQEITDRWAELIAARQAFLQKTYPDPAKASDAVKKGVAAEVALVKQFGDLMEARKAQLTQLLAKYNNIKPSDFMVSLGRAYKACEAFVKRFVNWAGSMDWLTLMLLGGAAAAGLYVWANLRRR